MALLVTLHISHSVSGVHTEGDNTLAECIFNFYPVATKGGSALHYIKQLYTMQKITVTQLHEFDFHPVPNKGVSGCDQRWHSHCGTAASLGEKQQNGPCIIH